MNFPSRFQCVRKVSIRPRANANKSARLGMICRSKREKILFFFRRVWSEKKSNWYIIFSSLLSSSANVIWLRRQNWSFELVHLEREKRIQKSSARKNCFQWGFTDTMTTGRSVYFRIIRFDLLIKMRLIYEGTSIIAREKENKSEWGSKERQISRRRIKWK